MKIIDKVYVQILSRRSFRRREDLFELMEFHEYSLPQIRPLVYNWTDPVNKPWNLSKPEGYIPNDGFFDINSIYWNRKKKPKASGYFYVDQRFENPSYEPSHGGPSFVVELSDLDVGAAVKYIKTASLKFDADLAQVHWVSEQEEHLRFDEYSLDSAGANGSAELLTRRLRHWLPVMPWAVVFGEAYVRMFGLDRLLSAPAYIVEKLSDDAVYLQLSANLTDLKTDYDTVHAVREKIQAHLGCDAFFDANRAYPLRAFADDIPMDQLLKAISDFRCPPPGTNGFRVPEFLFTHDGLPLTTITTSISNVEGCEKYDDASWHYGGDFPENLPPEAGMTHMAMYWTWALLSGLGKDDKLREKIAQEFKGHRASPRSCFSQKNGEKLTDADFSQEGKAFTEYYYEDNYSTDYAAVLAAESGIYEVSDSWDAFALLAPVLDMRLSEWRSRLQ